MLLPITLTFAAAAALLNMWLAWRVGKLRMSLKVLHGDGDDPVLLRRMRAQANFVEYTPFALILCAAVELALGSPDWLWILALVFVLARVAHAFGMDMGRPNAWRSGGILLTYVATLILAGAALYAVYASHGEIEAPPSLAQHL